MNNDTQTVTATDTAIVDHVSKFFPSGGGQVKAVDDISFTVPRGKLVVLRGPSGCGKSTLLNLLGALDKPDSGTIMVDGVDVARLSGKGEVEYRRRKVGFVFQMFNLMPQLSAVENVMLPMELAGGNGDMKSRAQTLLGRVGLAEDRWIRRPFKLSGGEQQRVAIARALANDCPLVLADEPTANLDSKTGALIVQLLRGLTDDNSRTVLIATHDDSIARQADVVMEMRDGQLVNRIGD